MSQFLGYCLLASIVGVPVVAVAVVYRENLGPCLVRLGRALAFDPRHPAFRRRSAPED